MPKRIGRPPKPPEVRAGESRVWALLGEAQSTQAEVCLQACEHVTERAALFRLCFEAMREMSDAAGMTVEEMAAEILGSLDEVIAASKVR